MALEVMSVVEHERVVAEMRLKIEQLTQRYDSANKDRNARADERANLVSQLYQYGLHVNIDGKVVRSQAAQESKPIIMITKEVDLEHQEKDHSGCTNCGDCGCDKPGKGAAL